MLKTKNIKLTPVTRKDLPFLFKWINDRELVLNSAPYMPVSEMQHEAWFNTMIEKKDAFLFGIRLLKNDLLIGTCQLHSLHQIHRSCELQIRMGEAQHRGHGYGREAVSLLLGYAFRDLDLHRVFVHVLDGNQTAIKTYLQAGFTQEGILRKAACINGQYVNVLVMGILREDYDRSHSSA